MNRFFTAADSPPQNAFLSTFRSSFSPRPASVEDEDWGEKLWADW